MPDRRIPRLKGLDHTVSILREGYGFASRGCQALATDIFAARFLLQPVIFVRGQDWAKVFYEGNRFTRRRAMPPTTLRLLQDKGSVQQLDGPAHLSRKALFVDLLMGEEAEAQLLGLFRAEWQAAVERWEMRRRIVLLDEITLLLTRAACRWMEIPIDGSDANLAEELASMVAHAGRFGPSTVRAMLRRRKVERYLEGVIFGSRDAPTGTSPLQRIAQHRDPGGRLLTAGECAVEVLNVLRPTVAAGRFIVFVAMALAAQPAWREWLCGEEDAALERFVEEVRRLYPFFPLIGGRATAPFEHGGYSFAAGDWVVLDLYGTNHDPRLFPEPYRLDPDRNLSWRDQGYDFIPQGGGSTSLGHRCPGERMTVALMRESCRLLVEDIAYDVPPQDLSLPFDRMPTQPPTGMVLANIRRRRS